METSREKLTSVINRLKNSDTVIPKYINSLSKLFSRVENNMSEKLKSFKPEAQKNELVFFKLKKKNTDQITMFSDAINTVMNNFVDSTRNLKVNDVVMTSVGGSEFCKEIEKSVHKIISETDSLKKREKELLKELNELNKRFKPDFTDIVVVNTGDTERNIILGEKNRVKYLIEVINERLENLIEEKKIVKEYLENKELNFKKLMETSNFLKNFGHTGTLYEIRKNCGDISELNNAKKVFAQKVAIEEKKNNYSELLGGTKKLLKILLETTDEDIIKNEFDLPEDFSLPIVKTKLKNIVKTALLELDHNVIIKILQKIFKSGITEPVVTAQIKKYTQIIKENPKDFNAINMLKSNIKGHIKSIVEFYYLTKLKEAYNLLNIKNLDSVENEIKELKKEESDLTIEKLEDNLLKIEKKVQTENKFIKQYDDYNKYNEKYQKKKEKEEQKVKEKLLDLQSKKFSNNAVLTKIKSNINDLENEFLRLNKLVGGSRYDIDIKNNVVTIKENDNENPFCVAPILSSYIGHLDSYKKMLNKISSLVSEINDKGSLLCLRYLREYKTLLRITEEKAKLPKFIDSDKVKKMLKNSASTQDSFNESLLDYLSIVTSEGDFVDTSLSYHSKSILYLLDMFG